MEKIQKNDRKAHKTSISEIQKMGRYFRLRVFLEGYPGINANTNLNETPNREDDKKQNG